MSVHRLGGVCLLLRPQFRYDRLDAFIRRLGIKNSPSRGSPNRLILFESSSTILNRGEGVYGVVIARWLGGYLISNGSSWLAVARAVLAFNRGCRRFSSHLMVEMV